MSRRRGTGSIFRKPGCATWVIQFYKDGQRIREATGLTDRAAAQRRLTTRLYQVDKNEFAARERRAVRIEELFAALAEHTLNNRPKAAAALGRRWKHLSASFAAMLAANLTTDDIHHYIRQRQEQGAQNATVNRELSALKRMFNLGRQSTPPKVRVVPFIPMLKEDNVRSGFVEDGEFSRLAAEASDLWLRTFLELAYSYGWRKGELLGLRVRQTDLRLRTIRLDVGSTKNGEGREVAMTSKVEELLRQATAGKGPDDFVLTRPDGRPVKDFRKTWRNLCTRADLPTLIVHDLRRSAAKALRAAGVPESVVMSIGGWKTAAIFRRYAIVSSADQRAAMEKLEQSRSKNSPYFGPYSGQTVPPRTSARGEKVQ